MALAFGATYLATVHTLSFVWLTAHVYHSNIRGYVPAGMTGLFYLFIAWLFLQVHLTLVGIRRCCMGPYFAAGFVAVPVGVLMASFYAGILLALFGYSLQTDIAINAVGSVLFAILSLTFHRCYLSRNADNNSVEPTRALG